MDGDNGGKAANQGHSTGKLGRIIELITALTSLVVAITALIAAFSSKSDATDAKGSVQKVIQEVASAEDRVERIEEGLMGVRRNSEIAELEATAPTIPQTASQSPEIEWRISASIDRFSDGPADCEDLVKTKIYISDQHKESLDTIELSVSQPETRITVFTPASRSTLLNLAIDSTSNMGHGPGNERATISSILHLTVERIAEAGEDSTWERDVPIVISSKYHLGAADMSNSRPMSMGTVVKIEARP